MSGLDNPLKMDEKFEDLPVLGDWRKPRQVEVCGKSHTELRVDTQFVRFLFNGRHSPLTLNNIRTDEKELKMLTKGQM
jgi:hypothetical protein